MRERLVSRWALPRRGALALGLVLAALGAAVVFRPFASLAVLVVTIAAGGTLLGIERMLGAARAASPALARATGAMWLALAVAVLAWPGATLRTVAVLVGLGMIASGALRIVGGLRGTTDERFAAIVFGAASIGFGILALAWPDLRVFIVAFLFGVELILAGISLLLGALRGPRDARSPGTLGRWSRALGAVVALAVALALLGASAWLRGGEPTVSAFYDTPDEVPAEPGALLRSEPATNGIPAGAEAWRILYTTTSAEGVPAVASGLVVASADRPDGPRPVIAWAHGTTGVERTCAPSVLDDPFGAGAMPALDQVLANGWVLVATDYIGLGAEGDHAYLVGQPAGRAVLDAVRAARQLETVRLEERTVVWGHSQGGHAALWTGILAPAYAPDVNVIGVAAMAPASNLPGLVDNLEVVPGGAIFGAYVIAGYSAAYDDVEFDAYVRPAARPVMREIAARCLAEPEVFVSIVSTFLFDRSPWDGDPAAGALGQRLDQNVPRDRIEAPLLLAQGLGDGLVLPEAQEAFAREQCAAGTMVDVRTYPDLGHVEVIEDDSPLVPDLLAWTQARLDGAAAGSTCA